MQGEQLGGLPGAPKVEEDHLLPTTFLVPDGFYVQFLWVIGRRSSGGEVMGTSRGCVRMVCWWLGHKVGVSVVEPEAAGQHREFSPQPCSSRKLRGGMKILCPAASTAISP